VEPLAWKGGAPAAVLWRCVVCESWGTTVAWAGISGWTSAQGRRISELRQDVAWLAYQPEEIVRELEVLEQPWSA
jgi:hypothetical protein